jgi:hypothetical protein
MNIYPSPKNLFQQKIRSIFQKEPKETTSLIVDILKMFCLTKLNRPQQAKNWEPLNEILNQFGTRIFIDLLDIFEGKTIRFPTRKEIKDLIISALCYYYKEVENKSWEEVKEILYIQENSTIQYGIKVRQLKTFIEQGITSTLFQKKKRKSNEQ